MKIINERISKSNSFWLMHESYIGRRPAVIPTIVRSSSATYEQVLESIKNGKYVKLEAAVAWRQVNETDSQFELMLAAEGVQIDFEVFEAFDGDGKCVDYRLVDRHTGKTLCKLCELHAI